MASRSPKTRKSTARIARKAPTARRAGPTLSARAAAAAPPKIRTFTKGYYDPAALTCNPGEGICVVQDAMASLRSNLPDDPRLRGQAQQLLDQARLELIDVWKRHDQSIQQTMGAGHHLGLGFDATGAYVAVRRAPKP